eukprot:COSAG05_NODE_5453_length_1169_cov_1.528037_1_plen_207_part_01
MAHARKVQLSTFRSTRADPGKMLACMILKSSVSSSRTRTLASCVHHADADIYGARPAGHIREARCLVDRYWPTVCRDASNFRSTRCSCIRRRRPQLRNCTMAADLVAKLRGSAGEREAAYTELFRREAEHHAKNGGSRGGRGTDSGSTRMPSAIHVGGLEGELEDEVALAKVFGRFGTVLAATLRVRREGKKVSWALVSFGSVEQAQ